MTIQTLSAITRTQRALRPDQVALHYSLDDRSWTYEALDIEACQCANALQQMGVG